MLGSQFRYFQPEPPAFLAFRSGIGLTHFSRASCHGRLANSIVHRKSE